ncbi:hypothetical protein ACFX15_034732 [Malus domestica]
MHSLHLRPPSPTSQVLPSQTVATTISDFVFDSSGFPWITKDGVIWQPMPQQNCGVWACYGISSCIHIWDEYSP